MPQSLHNTLSTLKNNNLNVENIYSIPHSRSNNFLRAISGSQSTPRKSTAKLNEEGIEEAIICSLENFEIKNPIGLNYFLLKNKRRLTNVKVMDLLQLFIMRFISQKIQGLL
jgi:hypothetical protein